MGRDNNIFTGIVNCENDMTELLCNFMTFKPFRNAFIELFHSDDLILFSYDDFQTQYTTDINQSRPDMVISNNESEILIEIKTWDTGLTSNQPYSYLEHLKCVSKPHKYLVFLVPSNYCFLSEWQARTKAWIKENNYEINVKTIYWEEVIGAIENNDLNLLSDKFRDFYELLKSWFKLETVKFKSMEAKYMFNSEIPEILRKLYTIIDQVHKHFLQNYSISKSMNSEEYGIYIYNKEDKKPLLYFGVWYPFWEEKKKPLCYGVYAEKWPKDIVNKFTEAHKDNLEEFGGFKMVCIEKDILVNEACSEEITNLIKKELEMLLGKK